MFLLLLTLCFLLPDAKNAGRIADLRLLSLHSGATQVRLWCWLYLALVLFWGCSGAALVRP